VNKKAVEQDGQKMKGVYMSNHIVPEKEEICTGVIA